MSKKIGLFGDGEACRIRQINCGPMLQDEWSMVFACHQVRETSRRRLPMATMYTIIILLIGLYRFFF